MNKRTSKTSTKLPLHPDPRVEAERRAALAAASEVTPIGWSEKPGFVGLGNGSRKRLTYTAI